MQFIDKTLNREKRHDIVRKFVAVSWQSDSQQYINLNYESFDKKKMVDLTVEEQKEQCCYCMRKLYKEGDKKNVTLEHVIPNKSDSADIFKDYFGYGELNETNIFFWEVKNKQVTPPPFPHFIAYENLVASCNGAIMENGKEKINLHQCCNNRRENKAIKPFFYLENVNEIIQYEKDGKLSYDPEFELESTFKILNLEHSSLVLNRKAWCSISSIYSVEEVNKAISDIEHRKNILADSDLKTNDTRNLEKNIYWDLLCEFDWFFEYYTKKANEEANYKAKPIRENIAFDDFTKLDIRVGTVLECAKVPKADKLLQFKIDDGLETRTIVSGIAQHYKPEQLIGKQVCFVANLAPRKLKRHRFGRNDPLSRK